MIKKLDRLILKSFLGPLALTFTLAVFVLLMQFVWKYIDDLVGKGLDFMVIAELLFYAAATFVPMALPIAVLFASIMTMGNFGEHYELVAMKAGGISLKRVMLPMMMVCLLLTGVAFYFSNNVLPIAMLKYRTTLYDVTRKKPAVNIRTSEYYDEIDGYVIRVNGKSADEQTLEDITIYDHSHGSGENNVIVAKSGEMRSSADEAYLIFTLFDGYTYSESMYGEDYAKRPLTRIGFEKQVLSFDVSAFAFNKSDDSFFKGNYHMMSISQLDTTIQAMNLVLDTICMNYKDQMENKLQTYKLYRTADDSIQGKKIDIESAISKLDPIVKGRVLNQAKVSSQMALSDVQSLGQTYLSEKEYINYLHIEWQRRYTLSLACLLLFLVGAPFGSIVRKGGLGVPLVASVLFFVFYYMIGMIAEKMVRTSAVGPIGMWFSTFVFLPIGIFLTLYATGDLRKKKK